jgi:hypothetical protein
METTINKIPVTSKRFPPPPTFGRDQQRLKKTQFQICGSHLLFTPPHMQVTGDGEMTCLKDCWKSFQGSITHLKVVFTSI